MRQKTVTDSTGLTLGALIRQKYTVTTRSRWTPPAEALVLHHLLLVLTPPPVELIWPLSCPAEPSLGHSQRALEVYRIHTHHSPQPTRPFEGASCCTAAGHWQWVPMFREKVGRSAHPARSLSTFDPRHALHCCPPFGSSCRRTLRTKPTNLLH